jgi:hypothetical protein
VDVGLHVETVAQNTQRVLHILREDKT